ncbi:hypothetical protein [Dokdonia sp.]|uniref:hypothetical protein n=1 Tax=Dokdonia sp. TaxID=2024995 RepID=UPI0032638962
MNTQNWNIDNDGTSVHSISEVYIPWLGDSMKTWFEIEENQTWWTDRQAQVFEEFLNLSINVQLDLIDKLQQVYLKSLENGRIENVLFEDILKSIDWKKSHICIPQHYESKNQYAFLLLETKWKLTDSDFTFELEMLFTNGKIEIVQEMSGLWNRIEWFEDYLKRKNTKNTI